MKRKVRTLTETTAYLLEEVRLVEIAIEERLTGNEANATASTVSTEIGRYARSSKYKRMKLKRVFNYLMVAPYGRQSALANNLIQNIKKAASQAEGDDKVDLLSALELLPLISFKISRYEQTAELAELLDLATAAELLREIRDMEKLSMALFRKLAESLAFRVQQDELIEESA